jgi:hypothetical protein
MVGVNPEVAHEQMAGLNFLHAVAQAWEAGKLFHIDLNDQVPGRYDQDLRFGSANVKAAFWLVKFLEDVGYAGPRHFDAHAYRTEDSCGVRDFALGCMRSYVILRERARRWNADTSGARRRDGQRPRRARAGALLRATSRRPPRHDVRSRRDRAEGSAYARLDQLTMELLPGAVVGRQSSVVFGLKSRWENRDEIRTVLRRRRGAAAAAASRDGARPRHDPRRRAAGRAAVGTRDARAQEEPTRPDCSRSTS